MIDNVQFASLTNGKTWLHIYQQKKFLNEMLHNLYCGKVIQVFSRKKLVILIMR